jgi:hypothetical protein
VPVGRAPAVPVTLSAETALLEASAGASLEAHALVLVRRAEKRTIDVALRKPFIFVTS